MLNYREAGQDVLFNVTKWHINVLLSEKRSLVFLYQPLKLESTARLEKDLYVDNVRFNAGTAIHFLYSFPFYRMSYLVDKNPDPFEERAYGVSMQLRNATINFESSDGEKLVTQRDVGLVPILKFRSRNALSEKWWWGTELDGFYAPISYLNGSDTEVIGSILDANFTFGTHMKSGALPYVNLRYISGGAVGDSEDAKFSGDGFNENWLHFLAVQLGVELEL